MIERAKESWWRFRASKPGHRFQDRHHRRQQSSGGRFAPGRLFYVVGGAVIAVASLFTAPLPGPGFGTLAIGLGMIAGEFLPGARFLDWAEVRLRKAARAARTVWTRASPTGKALITLLILVVAVALAYGAYYLLFGGRG